MISSMHEKQSFLSFWIPLRVSDFDAFCSVQILGLTISLSIPCVLVDESNFEDWTSGFISCTSVWLLLQGHRCRSRESGILTTQCAGLWESLSLLQGFVWKWWRKKAILFSRWETSLCRIVTPKTAFTSHDTKPPWKAKLETSSRFDDFLMCQTSNLWRSQSHFLWHSLSWSSKVHQKCRWMSVETPFLAKTGGGKESLCCASCQSIKRAKHLQCCLVSSHQ